MTSAEEVLFHIHSEWETKIRNMEPGPELDILVAEKVLGLIKDDVDRNLFKAAPRRYSTDISAAWELVEKMLERGGCEIGCYADKSGGKWFEVNVITMNGEVTVTAHTVSEAICKAALLAVMDGEDEHERD